MSWPNAQRRNPIRLVSLWTAGRRTSVLIKRRHPEVQAEIDRVYQELWRSSAKGGLPRQRKMIDWKGHTVQHSVMK